MRPKRTFEWRCLHCRQPLRDFVCVLRFATRCGSDMSSHGDDVESESSEAN